MTDVGIAGIGTYFPAGVETAADLVDRTNTPETVLREKMGIRQRHVAGEDDSVTQMASRAAVKALESAGIAPERVSVVISHGSEYKDHLVWNAAAKIQHNVGAINAYSFEMYALCAGAPIAINTAKAMMLADERLEYVLLAAGSRENDLVNLRNARARFMYNFGAGGGAMLLQRGATKNLILGASAFTDGSLSETVIMSRDPGAVEAGDEEGIGDLRGRLDVHNGDYMAERLGATSLANFRRVICEAVERSGASLQDVRFLGITHMKRSFYGEILASIGLTPQQSVYLEDFGHIQSVDQVLAIELGLAERKIQPGDLIVLAGAGTGYTWSAVAVRWG
jgi:3-oxoacyl-[acyl-carrier-protein] synthase-3